MQENTPGGNTQSQERRHPHASRINPVRFVFALLAPYIFLVAACALWLFVQGAEPLAIPGATKNWLSAFLGTYPVLYLTMLAVSFLQITRPRMAGITYAWLVIGCLCFVALGYYDRGQASRTVIQGAGMLLQKNRYGHYETQGSINGYPLTFLIDTGASITSVPGSLARQVGISSCEPRQFNTAGGEVTGCVARCRNWSSGPSSSTTFKSL